MEDTSAAIEAEAPVAAPVNDAPTPAEPAASEPKEEISAEESLDRDLRKAFRERNRSRDESGKFANKDGKPAPYAKAVEVDAEGNPVAQVQAEPAKPSVAMPPSWGRDQAERWSKLDPEAQQYIAQREQQVHQAISNYGRQLKAAEPIMQVIAQNQDVFRANNIAPAEGIAALVMAQKTLDANPVAGIANLAQMYGVDLRAMVAQMYGQAEGYADQSYDPNIAAIRQELEMTKRELQQWQAQQAAQQQAASEAQRESQVTSLVRQIDQFASDKPDFDDVQSEVMANLQVLQQSSPGLSVHDMLTQAYERAIWANPKTREARQRAEDAKRLQEAAKQADSARKAAQINVKGAPRPSSNQQADLDDVLRSKFREINRR